LKKKGFKEERVTKVGLYDIGTFTTLESNKSLSLLSQNYGNSYLLFLEGQYIIDIYKIN